MNRMILLLNLVVLVVSFALALSSTNSQIGILRSTSEAANAPRIPRRGAGDRSDAAIRYLRVVQSLENVAPAEVLDALTVDQLLSIRAAMFLYRNAVARGVLEGLGSDSGGRALLADYASIGKEARREIERELASHFDDTNVVWRLTAEIIRNSQ